MTEKEVKRQKIEKLEKKLENRKLTIYEALQEDCVSEWLKNGNPAFLTMLTPKSIAEIISYIVIPGPPDNKIRSFKIPLAATDMLASMNPKIIDLIFMQDETEKGSLVLNRLLSYFSTVPNYVISGYVVKILMNLMVSNAPRVLEQIMKSKPEQMIKFAESQSVADFILRILIVEDPLLNSMIKERLQLFSDVIDAYQIGKQSEETLAGINFILCECVTRLWTNKHKQLGRYSTLLFKLVEIVIDNNNLFQQENLIIILMRHLTVYNKQAPFLIIALYKKIYNEFLLNKSNQTTKNQGRIVVNKFSMKKLKMLQALHFIFLNSSDVIAKLLLTNNIFSFLMEFVSKYEWNNILLVEIEKIIRAALASNNEQVFYGLNRIYFEDKLKELVRLQATESKFGHGFSGFLKNIMLVLHQNYKANLTYAIYSKKTHPDGDFSILLEDYVRRKALIPDPNNSYKVVHDVAKPYYSINRLSQVFKGFFDEAEAINARMQIESPEKHVKNLQEEDVLKQIQNENQLVYQLLTQLVSDTVEEKKTQIESASD